MKTMIDTIKANGCASVRSCVLLHKKTEKNLKFDYWSDYIGFLCPVFFVVGYGLDYNENMRDFRHVCTIS